MIDLLRFVSGLVGDLVRGRAELVAKNAPLRQQLIVAHRKVADDGRLILESRVGGRRGGVQAGLGCVRRFRLRARVGRAITPSPVPASSSRTSGFPAPTVHLVGSRAGAVALDDSLAVPTISGFVPVEKSPWPRFQPPPGRTGQADFPRSAFLTTSCQVRHRGPLRCRSLRPVHRWKLYYGGR